MLNGYSLVKIVSVVISSFSQILLKKSADDQHDNIVREYLNFRVILAYGLFFGNTIMGIYALKGISISFSAILESFSYVFLPILGFFFLDEKMDAKQCIGTIIIIVGIIVFNM